LPYQRKHTKYQKRQAQRRVTVDPAGLGFAPLQDKLNVFTFKQSHQASPEADVFYAILDSIGHTYTHPSYSLDRLL
jgi:hypothetical protein